MRFPRHEGWSKVTISDSTVAIIGTGNIGSRLAANFAAGGQHFLLEQSIRIERFGDLHEYGALGRVVTRSEGLVAI
jgi:phosphoglycerate dehydrogenase-like enzyme